MVFVENLFSNGALKENFLALFVPPKQNIPMRPPKSWQKSTKNLLGGIRWGYFVSGIQRGHSAGGSFQVNVWGKNYIRGTCLLYKQIKIQSHSVHLG